MSTPLVRRTLSNAGWLTAGSAVEGVLQFAFLLVVSRELGPADYGFYEYVVSIVTFLLAIVNFGLQATAVREIAQAPDKLDTVYAAMFRIRGVLAALFFAGGVVGAVVMEDGIRATAVWLIFAYLLFVPFDLSSVFDGQKLSRMDVWGRISGRLTSFLLLLALWQADSRLTIAEAALCVAANIAVNVAVAWTVAGKVNARPRLRTGGDSQAGGMTWYLLRRSAPIMWASVATTVYTFSQPVLVQWYSTDVQTGFFGLANRLLLPLLIIRGLLSRLFLPLFSEVSADQATFEWRFSRVFHAMALFFAPVAALGIAAVELLVVLVFGAAYTGAVRPLQILLGYLFIAGAGSMFGTALFAQGHQKTYTWALTAAMAVNLLAAALLIPRYGAVGGAWAVFAAESLAVFIMGPAFLRVAKIHAWRRSLKITFISLGALSLYFLLTRVLAMDAVAAIGIELAALIALLWMAGEISSQRLAGLRDLIRRSGE